MKRDGAEYEACLNREIERHIEEMENPEYRFPARFGRRDYCAWAIVIAVCLVFLLLGTRM